MNENGHQRPHFEFAEFRLYPEERLLTKNETRVALTPRILDLLIVLVEQHGELIRKDMLLNSIWPDSFVEEGNLSRAVSTLRKNLGVQTNGSNYIETVPKLGYRFIAPVQQINDYQSEQITSNSTEATSRTLMFGTALLLLFGIGLSLYFVLRPANPIIVGGLTNLTNNIAEDE